MFHRVYFINARATDQSGYSYNCKLVSHTSFFANPSKVYSEAVDDLKKELEERRPHALFEVVSFNRV